MAVAATMQVGIRSWKVKSAAQNPAHDWIKRPYIGITGVMSKYEVWDILWRVPANSKRLIMFGALASLKTLRGFQNKCPKRYPKIGHIAGVFADHPLALNLIHYNSGEAETLDNQLTAITELGGEHLHGLQLNIAWPLPKVLEAYRKKYPAKKLVLQIGRRAFKIVGDSPEKLAQKVTQEYHGLIDYLLLDSSGGEGRLLDPDRTYDYLSSLGARNLSIGLGAAGGLCAENVEVLEPILKLFSDISIDAEGRLRDEEDNLDLIKARRYVLRALKMFGN